MHLLATESTGTLSPAVTLLLKALAKATLRAMPSGTVWARPRPPPVLLLPCTHHLAAISFAIVRADAQPVDP